MYKAEELRKDARGCARDMLCRIDRASQHAEDFVELTEVLMEGAIVSMENAMKVAYFKGLRDATWVFEERKSLQNLKDAITKVSEELN